MAPDFQFGIMWIRLPLIAQNGVLAEFGLALPLHGRFTGVQIPQTPQHGDYGVNGSIVDCESNGSGSNPDIHPKIYMV